VYLVEIIYTDRSFKKINIIMFSILKKTLPFSYLINQNKDKFFKIKNGQQVFLNRKNLSNSKKGNRDYFLKRIGLDEKDITWPESSKNDTNVDYWKKNPSDIKGMYGKGDLSKLPVFKGGYINFGFWQDLNDTNFDTTHRTQASELLYREIAEMAHLNKESAIVDVGCGIGFGTQYIMTNYRPKVLVGLDFTPQQISKAKKYHKDVLASFADERFKFIVGDAMQMPFPDDSFSHVISVEAVQHFPSLKKFIAESHRILKPGGRLVFTTFFPVSSEGREAVKTLVPDYTIHCSDTLAVDVVSDLEKSFKQVKIQSIGERVWPGLEKWLKKIGYQNQWTMLWPALYKANYIDYFIFRAEIPDCRLYNSPEITCRHKSFTK